MNSNNNKNFNNSINHWIDFWSRKIGVNVIYGDSKIKSPYSSWKEAQTKPIPIEEIENMKKQGKFQKGIFVIPGKVWKGDHKDQYLIVIDIDREKGIKEFLKFFGKDTTVEDFSKKTMVVQHRDEKNKAHFYFYSTIPFERKSSDNIVGIEIKNNHDLICVPPSIHKNGERYEIIGIDIPIELTEKQALELMQHIDNICRNKGIKYLEKTNGKLSSNLKQIIKTLKIDDSVKIVEGTRHNTLLWIANSLLSTYKNSKNISKQRLRDFFFEINDKLCTPEPLPDKEVKCIWKDVLNHINNHCTAGNNKGSIHSNNPDKNKLIREASEQILARYFFATIEETKEILYYQGGVYRKDRDT